MEIANAQKGDLFSPREEHNITSTWMFRVQRPTKNNKSRRETVTSAAQFA